MSAKADSLKTILYALGANFVIGVASVLRLITLQLGGSLMVAVKAHMRDSNAKDLVASINRTEVALRAAFPEVQWLFFEPDVVE